MNMMTVLLLLALTPPAASAREFHVSVRGDDAHGGSSSKPLKTISAAARLAQPGDVITVHEGTYRERVAPPRGGESDTRRIVYRAAPGEKVVLKGSEVVSNWAKAQGDVWKVVLPNTFFGDFNPYGDIIHGDWFDPKGREHHTGAVYLNGNWLTEAANLDEVLKPVGTAPLWFGRQDKDETTIWAQFKGSGPNGQLVEINVRRTVFYPEIPGINFITLRGFTLQHAATPWAPPTAEQVGLVGTHWSKGWIIENNEISHSRCSGVTLGKYGDEWDNRSANSAEGYVKTIERALKNGWNKETIGHHIVRNNVIHDCEQTGICGSLGAVFSRITDNHIYNIWVQRQFAGAEMGGIKIHASIDMLIRKNRIHNAGRGIWMDWMAQGTRITGNLCYDNSTDDLFVEVNHGPFLVDNNLFLSLISLRDWSEGGAYAHNLMVGRIESRQALTRSTPYHEAHSTALAGLANIQGGDNRFYNNIFVGGGEAGAGTRAADPKNLRRFFGFGLWVYDAREFLLQTGGNVYYNEAWPYAGETGHPAQTGIDPKVEVVERGPRVYLDMTLALAAGKPATTIVTTELLGRARIPGLPYERPDGNPLRIDTDYFLKQRKGTNPTPGPFENRGAGRLHRRIW